MSLNPAHHSDLKHDQYRHCSNLTVRSSVGGLLA
jgi:hypothetical protein